MCLKIFCGIIVSKITKKVWKIKENSYKCKIKTKFNRSGLRIVSFNSILYYLHNVFMWSNIISKIMWNQEKNVKNFATNTET